MNNDRIVAGDELQFPQRFLDTQRVAPRPLRVRESRMRMLLLGFWLFVLVVTYFIWRAAPPTTNYPTAPPRVEREASPAPSGAGVWRI